MSSINRKLRDAQAQDGLFNMTITGSNGNEQNKTEIKEHVSKDSHPLQGQRFGYSSSNIRNSRGSSSEKYTRRSTVVGPTDHFQNEEKEDAPANVENNANKGEVDTNNKENKLDGLKHLPRHIEIQLLSKCPEIRETAELVSPWKEFDVLDCNSFENTKNLDSWLNENEISTLNWGYGKAKSVEELFTELKSQEIVFVSEKDPGDDKSKPLRIVRVIRVVLKQEIRKKALYLLEASQEVGSTGRVRLRKNLLSSVMKPKESIFEAARRSVCKELQNIGGDLSRGIKSKDVRILRSSVRVKLEQQDSKSYPSLSSRYILYTVHVKIKNTLPARDFYTTELNPDGSVAVKHYWKWRTEAQIKEVLSSKKENKSKRNIEISKPLSEEESDYLIFDLKTTLFNPNLKVDTLKTYLTRWGFSDSEIALVLSNVNSNVISKDLFQSDIKSKIEKNFITVDGKNDYLNRQQNAVLKRLFPFCSKLNVHLLHGGFSGSMVIQVHSFAPGEQLDPTVVKIDKRKTIRDERIRYVKIAPMMGDSAPRILSADVDPLTKDDVEVEDGENVLGGLTFELVGACWFLPDLITSSATLLTAFSELFLKEQKVELASLEKLQNRQKEMDIEEKGEKNDAEHSDSSSESDHSEQKHTNVDEVYGDVFQVFKEVFGEILRTTTLESRKRVSMDLYSYYEIEKQIKRQILHEIPAKGKPINVDDLESSQNKGRTKLLFKTFMEKMKNRNTNEEYYEGVVHGDLNGLNILIDSQEIVWLIDFAYTGRGHVLKDLAKLESSILLEYASIESEEDIEEAKKFIDELMDLPSLHFPLPLPAHTSKLKFVKSAIRCLRTPYVATYVGDDPDPIQMCWALLFFSLKALQFRESTIQKKKVALYLATRCAEKILLCIQENENKGLNSVKAECPGLCLNRNLNRCLDERQLEYERRRYFHKLLVKEAYIVDVITRKKVNIMEHCVPLDLLEGKTRMDVSKEKGFLVRMRTEKFIQNLKQKLAKRRRFSLKLAGNSLTCIVDKKESELEVKNNQNQDENVIKTKSHTHLFMYKFVILLGGAATGKSSLLRKMLISATQEQTGALDDPVPLLVILVDLRRLMAKLQLTSSDNLIDVYMKHTYGQESGAYAFLRRALNKKRIFLLLDGLDEAGEKKAAIEDYICRCKNEFYKIVISSRETGFNEEPFKGFHFVEVLPLSSKIQEKIVVARLGKSHPNFESVLSTIKKPCYKDLAENPLILSLLVSLLATKEEEDNVPFTRTKLYDMAIAQLLYKNSMMKFGMRRENEDKSIELLTKTLAKPEVYEFLKLVAWHTHCGRKRDISPKTLTTLAELHLKERSTTLISNRNGHQNKERRALEEDNDEMAIELFDLVGALQVAVAQGLCALFGVNKDINVDSTSSLDFKSSVKDSDFVFRFIHLSFQEHLCALYMLDKLKKARETSADDFHDTINRILSTSFSTSWDGDEATLPELKNDNNSFDLDVLHDNWWRACLMNLVGCMEGESDLAFSFLEYILQFVDKLSHTSISTGAGTNVLVASNLIRNLPDTADFSKVKANLNNMIKEAFKRNHNTNQMIAAMAHVSVLLQHMCSYEIREFTDPAETVHKLLTLLEKQAMHSIIIDEKSEDGNVETENKHMVSVAGHNWYERGGICCALGMFPSAINISANLNTESNADMSMLKFRVCSSLLAATQDESLYVRFRAVECIKKLELENSPFIVSNVMELINSSDSRELHNGLELIVKLHITDSKVIEAILFQTISKNRYLSSRAWQTLNDVLDYKAKHIDPQDQLPSSTRVCIIRVLEENALDNANLHIRSNAIALLDMYEQDPNKEGSFNVNSGDLQAKGNDCTCSTASMKNIKKRSHGISISKSMDQDKLLKNRNNFYGEKDDLYCATCKIRIEPFLSKKSALSIINKKIDQERKVLVRGRKGTEVKLKAIDGSTDPNILDNNHPEVILSMLSSRRYPDEIKRTILCSIPHLWTSSISEETSWLTKVSLKELIPNIIDVVQCHTSSTMKLEALNTLASLYIKFWRQPNKGEIETEQIEGLLDLGKALTDCVCFLLNFASDNKDILQNQDTKCRVIGFVGKHTRRIPTKIGQKTMTESPVVTLLANSEDIFKSMCQLIRDLTDVTPRVLEISINLSKLEVTQLPCFVDILVSAVPSLALSKSVAPIKLPVCVQIALLGVICKSIKRNKLSSPNVELLGYLEKVAVSDTTSDKLRRTSLEVFTTICNGFLDIDKPLTEVNDKEDCVLALLRLYSCFIELLGKRETKIQLLAISYIQGIDFKVIKHLLDKDVDTSKNAPPGSSKELTDKISELLLSLSDVFSKYCEESNNANIGRGFFIKSKEKVYSVIESLIYMGYCFKESDWDKCMETNDFRVQQCALLGTGEAYIEAKVSVFSECMESENIDTVRACITRLFRHQVFSNNTVEYESCREAARNFMSIKCSNLSLKCEQLVSALDVYSGFVLSEQIVLCQLLPLIKEIDDKAKEANMQPNDFGCLNAVLDAIVHAFESTPFTYNMFLIFTDIKKYMATSNKELLALNVDMDLGKDDPISATCCYVVCSILNHSGVHNVDIGIGLKKECMSNFLFETCKNFISNVETDKKTLIEREKLIGMLVDVIEQNFRRCNEFGDAFVTQINNKDETLRRIAIKCLKVEPCEESLRILLHSIILCDPSPKVKSEAVCLLRDWKEFMNASTSDFYDDVNNKIEFGIESWLRNDLKELESSTKFQDSDIECAINAVETLSIFTKGVVSSLFKIMKLDEDKISSKARQNAFEIVCSMKEIPRFAMHEFLALGCIDDEDLNIEKCEVPVLAWLSLLVDSNFQAVSSSDNDYEEKSTARISNLSKDYNTNKEVFPSRYYRSFIAEEDLSLLPSLSNFGEFRLDSEREVSSSKAELASNILTDLNCREDFEKMMEELLTNEKSPAVRNAVAKVVVTRSFCPTILNDVGLWESALRTGLNDFELCKTVMHFQIRHKDIPLSPGIANIFAHMMNHAGTEPSHGFLCLKFFKSYHISHNSEAEALIPLLADEYVAPFIFDMLIHYLKTKQIAKEARNIQDRDLSTSQEETDKWIISVEKLLEDILKKGRKPRISSIASNENDEVVVGDSGSMLRDRALTEVSFLLKSLKSSLDHGHESENANEGIQALNLTHSHSLSLHSSKYILDMRNAINERNQKVLEDWSAHRDRWFQLTEDDVEVTKHTSVSLPAYQRSRLTHSYKANFYIAADTSHMARELYLIHSIVFPMVNRRLIAMGLPVECVGMRNFNAIDSSAELDKMKSSFPFVIALLTEDVCLSTEEKEHKDEATSSSPGLGWLLSQSFKPNQSLFYNRNLKERNNNEDTNVALTDILDMNFYVAATASGHNNVLKLKKYNGDDHENFVSTLVLDICQIVSSEFDHLWCRKNLHYPNEAGYRGINFDRFSNEEDDDEEQAETFITEEEINGVISYDLNEDRDLQEAIIVEKSTMKKSYMKFHDKTPRCRREQYTKLLDLIELQKKRDRELRHERKYVQNEKYRTPKRHQGNTPIVVAGEVGSGKSSFLTTFVNYLRHTETSNNRTVYHCCGSTMYGSDFKMLLLRLGMELKSIFKFHMDTADLISPSKDLLDMRTAIEWWYRVLERASELSMDWGFRPILVLDSLFECFVEVDSLDLMEVGQDVSGLLNVLLPESYDNKVPPGITMIVSSSIEMQKKLKKRNEKEALVILSPLERDQRRNVAEYIWMETFGVEPESGPDSEIIKMLASHPSAEKPLFVKIACDIYAKKHSGEISKLENFLEKLPKENFEVDCQLDNEIESVFNFLVMEIEQLIGEDLAGEILCTLCVGNFLTELDLYEIIWTGQTDKVISPDVWRSILALLSPLVRCQPIKHAKLADASLRVYITSLHNSALYEKFRSSSLSKQVVEVLLSISHDWCKKAILHKYSSLVPAVNRNLSVFWKQKLTNNSQKERMHSNNHGRYGIRNIITYALRSDKPDMLLKQTLGSKQFLLAFFEQPQWCNIVEQLKLIYEMAIHSRPDIDWLKQCHSDIFQERRNSYWINSKGYLDVLENLVEKGHIN